MISDFRCIDYYLRARLFFFVVLIAIVTIVNVLIVTGNTFNNGDVERRYDVRRQTSQIAGEILYPGFSSESQFKRVTCLPDKAAHAVLAPGIELILEPGIQKTWEEFVNFEPFSVALDGYVTHPPMLDRNGPCANFDHHCGVIRLSTPSTCLQVWNAVRNGFFELFSLDGRPRAIIRANDCDPDVAYSIAVLSRFSPGGKLLDSELLKKAIAEEHRIDSFAGACPINPEDPFMRKLAWVNKPYMEAKTSGALSKMNALSMLGIINQTCDRLEDLVAGRAQEVELDTSYEKLASSERSKSWIMVRETGPYARSKLVQEGYKFLVSCAPLPGDRFFYMITALAQDLIALPGNAADFFNELEGLSRSSLFCWGGSDIFTVSPRGLGSLIRPEEMPRMIEKLLGS